jgi:hypothetical protein
MAVTAELVSVAVIGDCCGHMLNICLAGFEVSTAVLLRFQILWDLHGSKSERRIFLDLFDGEDEDRAFVRSVSKH